LDPGVASALRTFKECYRPSAEPQSAVFLDSQGQPVNRFGLADVLRSHLIDIGLLRERPELFTTTPERRPIRTHDLRGTFVTISLANGRSESWISDRTGHRSSQMIAR
jgi:integrase